jgi:hypothetical protein
MLHRQLDMTVILDYATDTIYIAMLELGAAD